MKHAVILASTGRPEILGATLEALMLQTVPADQIIVSVTAETDLPQTLPAGPQVVIGPRGLTRQRNAGLDALADDVDLVTFFDDDAEPAHDYLETAQRFAGAHPEVALFDGRMVADGARTGEIDRASARSILGNLVPSQRVLAQPEAYGCNMNVPAAVARAVRFDERLPLYGWLEDRDFAVRCGRLGRVVLFEGCAVVHLGAHSGRISGTHLGYSQIVNPHYLWRKGVLRPGQLLAFWMHAVGGNVNGWLRRDVAIDRSARLRGNLRGFRGVLLGLGPEALAGTSKL